MPKRLRIDIEPNDNPAGTLYRIERASDEFFSSNVTIVKDWGTALYTIDMVNEGEIYYYRTKAKAPNGQVETAWSPVIDVISPPGAPTNFKVINPTDTTLTLIWDVMKGASEYIVKRDGVEVYKGASAFFTDTGRKAGTSYNYSVVALNQSGISDPSVLSATTGVANPTNLRANGITTSAMRVSWDTVDGAATYELKRDNTVVYTGTTPYFDVTGLLAGTLYDYELVAIATNGTRGNPAKLSVPTLPDMPSDLTYSNVTQESVRLSWTPTHGATSYELRRNGVIVYEGTNTVFNDTGLVGSTQYVYSVAAKNASGVGSPKTASVTTGLVMPLNFNVSAVGETTVTLRWDSVPGATSYVLTRDGAQVYSGTNMTFTDSGRVGNTKYKYALVARNATSDSDPVEVEAITVVSSPRNFRASNVTQTSMKLQWDAPAGGSAATITYVLKRNATAIYTGSQISFDDTGLIAETEYTYTVEAINSAGNSSPIALTQKTMSNKPAAPSISVQIVDVSGPAGPTSLSAENVQEDSATLKWT